VQIGSGVQVDGGHCRLQALDVTAAA
jgi:hypothetical protein